MALSHYHSCVLRRGGSKAAFTLIEMLVVVLIMSLAFGCFLAFLGGDSNITGGAYNITGIFQQAQSVAVSRSTYVWVGIFEENPTVPGVQGVGQLVISAVASVDRTNLLSEVSGGSLPAAQLTQVIPLLKVPNVHIQTTLNTANISTLPSASYQIDPTLKMGTSFVYPLQGTPRYTFVQIVQFDPQGDVSIIYGNPVQLLQLGLVPAEGSTPVASSKNVLAIQICGIGGKTTVYRP